MKRYRSVKLDCDEVAEQYIEERRKARMGALEDEENRAKEKEIPEDELEDVQDNEVAAADGELVYSSSIDLDEFDDYID